MHSLRLCLASALLGLVATSLPAAEPAQQAAVNSPLSAEESLSQMVLSPSLDLQVKLAAAEPEVIDPVAIAFDAAGRMFVVEMRDYPNGPADGQPPLSRIKLLEDKDRDGRFETAHLFADKLLFATGVLPYKEGVIVTLAGEVRYLKDTDGDHKADLNELWFAGFAEENPQLRANHPTFGPDGRIYIANGLRGGTIEAKKPGWPAQKITLQGDFRFDPVTGEAEAVAGGSQFGLTFDSFGHRFLCSNRNPCDQVVLENADLARQPKLSIGKPIEVVVPAGNDSHIFPLVDAWTTSTLHSGQFTAACGVKIFTGDTLPGECSGNVFTCEPTGSLVHRERLTPSGGTFTAQPGEPEGAEFLASRDPWFRPVNLALGPDGALYVVDMYRAVIEHPQWMPVELRTRRDLRWGDDRGRIYRIAAKNNPLTTLTLKERSPAARAAALNHPNGWVRDTAFRLLAESADRSLPAEVAQIAAAGESAKARAAAAMLLAAKTQLTAEILLQLLSDENAAVVATAVRLSNPLLANEAVRQRILELADSPEPQVRFAVARQIGAFPGLPQGPQEAPAGDTVRDTELEAAVNVALAKIIIQDAARSWTRIAALTSTTDFLGVYDAAVKRDANAALPSLAEMAELVGRRKQPGEMAGLLQRIANTGPEGGWGLPILTGLGRGLGGTLEPALAASETRIRSRIGELFRYERAIAGGADVPVDQRVEAVRIVALANKDFAVPALLDLLKDAEPAVQLAAIEVVSRFLSDNRIATVLLEDLEYRTPAARSAVLDVLLRSSARTPLVLDAVEAGQIGVADLGPTRIDQLTKHPTAAIRDRAKKLFAPAADRQAVIEEYALRLQDSPDPRNGQALFKKNCAVCHRIGGEGVQVGPDIADSRTRTPAALLTDILDPNRAIDGNYVAYTALLQDGTVQTGLLAGETADTVLLKQAEGKTVTLPRAEIEELRSNSTSLMPNGVERTIKPDEMADLISYIKNWRYLKGDVPLEQPLPGTGEAK